MEAAYQLLVELCIRPEEDLSWAHEALPAVSDARRLLGAAVVEMDVPLDHALAAYARPYLMHLQAKGALETLTVWLFVWMWSRTRHPRHGVHSHSQHVPQGLAAPLKKRCKSFKNGPRAGRQLWLDLLATTLATLRTAVAQLQARAAALPAEEAAEAAGQAGSAPGPDTQAGAVQGEETAPEEAPCTGEGEEEPAGRAPRRKAAAAVIAAVEAERGTVQRAGATPPPATARGTLLHDVLGVMRHCHAFAKSAAFAGQAVMGVNEDPHTLARIVAPAAASRVEHCCVG